VSARWSVVALLVLSSCASSGSTPSDEATSAVAEPAGPPVEPTRFAFSELQVGERLELTEERDIAFVSDAGNRPAQRHRLADRFQVEILSTQKGFPARIRANVVTLERHRSSGDALQTPVSPLVGRTFLLDLTDPSSLTAQDGGQVLPADAELLQARLAALGRDDPFSAAVNGLALRPGDQAPALARAFVEELTRAESFRITPREATITFEGVEQEAARFTYSLDLAVLEAPSVAPLTIVLKGELRLAIPAGRLVQDHGTFELLRPGTRMATKIRRTQRRY
jgi:hypothetical protein